MPNQQLSKLARELQGSAILGIADEIRALVAQGETILNLTVGDFSPRQFRIPAALEAALVEAVRAGEANYPPPVGIEILRKAICEFYRARGRLVPELGSVLVAGGARPAIYSLYRALVDPGDRVVFGVPGWNNEYYCDLVGAEAVRLECGAATGFLPSAGALRPLLGGARLLALNSPLNPTGTCFGRDELAAICDLVLEENGRRSDEQRPLYLLYDQVYWAITTPGTVHFDPLELRPAIAPYLVSVDALSKAFAATGLRVGWAVAPKEIIRAVNNINGHIGAWAPRPEQLAAAKLLVDKEAVEQAVVSMRREAAARLDAVYDGFEAMRRAGLPVACLRPQGAIYAAVQVRLHGRRTPGGETLSSDDDIRRFLLRAAGLAAVPFGAFGSRGGEGWFRLSIGMVSVAELRAVFPRVQAALESVKG